MMILAILVCVACIFMFAASDEARASKIKQY